MKYNATKKFTLRISENINRFLEYKQKTTGLSKAEFIRLHLLEKMSNDIEFKKKIQ